MKKQMKNKKSSKLSRAIVCLLFIACTVMPSYLFAQGAAINTTGASADNSAMLDVSSTTQGVLVSRMTNAQKLAIPSPATGLMIYQTDGANPGFWYFNGTTWVQSIGVTGAAGATGATSTVPGPTGPSGLNGIAGATGPTGAASTVPGPTGAQGPSGANGTNGATGPTGPTGSGGSATCPAGFTSVNASYCIETNERAAATFVAAFNTCGNVAAGAHLCSLGEWFNACTYTSGLSSMTNNFEWVDEMDSQGYNNFSFTRALVVGSGGCDKMNINYGDITATNVYRCCFSK